MEGKSAQLTQKSPDSRIVPGADHDVPSQIENRSAWASPPTGSNQLM
jgi:hypothetical protein